MEVVPRLTSPVSYGLGEFELRIEAAPGQEVELQSTRDFKSWETAGTVTGRKEGATFSQKHAGNYHALFYRAVTGKHVSNYLGYLTLELPAGHSLISNPLQSPSMEIAALFPLVPEGTTLNKFNVTTFALVKNTFKRGRWSDPGQRLNPGEGILFYNPAECASAVRFVGEVPAVSCKSPVHPGTTLRASMLPLSGKLDTDLQFPIGVGDVVSLYSNHNEKYLEYQYTESGWKGGVPMLRPGEAFWIAKNGEATWNQKLPVSES